MKAAFLEITNIQKVTEVTNALLYYQTFIPSVLSAHNCGGVGYGVDNQIFFWN